MKKFLLSLLDSSNTTSSKRFVGLIGCISLIVSMFIYHTDTVFYCVTILSGSALAITGLESIFNKKG